MHKEPPYNLADKILNALLPQKAATSNYIWKEVSHRH